MLATRMRQAASGVPAGGGTPQYYVSFNGTTSLINCGADASLDDLPDADFTAEAWVYFEATENDGDAVLFGKSNNIAGNGWHMYRLNLTTPRPRVNLDDTDAFVSGSVSTETWFHIAMCWDQSTLTLEVFVNGTSAGTDTGVGTYVSDSSPIDFDFMIGDKYGEGSCLYGSIAWVRLSDTIRYTGSFTPDAKDSPPAVDGNTIEQWNLNDGSGNTASAEVNGSNDGSLTDVSWTAF